MSVSALYILFFSKFSDERIKTSLHARDLRAQARPHANTFSVTVNLQLIMILGCLDKVDKNATLMARR